MNIAGSKVFQNLAKLQEVPDEVNQIKLMSWFGFILKRADKFPPQFYPHSR